MSPRVHRFFPIAPILTLTLALVTAAGVQAASLPEFTDLAEKAAPSVVNISSKVAMPEGGPAMRQGPQGPQGPRGRNPLEEFFRDFFGEGMPMPRPQASLGSGFIISQDGFIVTNNHVVQDAASIEVLLDDGKDTYPAKVIGTDPETDLALIKIEPKTRLVPLEFGNSEQAKVGEWVLAVGNPFGLDHSVTAGIISAKGRVIGAGPYDNFIQTDASINPGNSGGPLINMAGKVIGINTAIVATGQGIGFAVPSDIAKSVIQQLREHGEVRRGLLGVAIQDMDANTAKALGLKEAQGALVASVSPGSPAAEAGIRQGDVITRVNGQPVEDSRTLTMRIGAMPPGERVKLTVWRGGKQKEYTVKLAKRSAEALGQMQPGQPGPQQPGGELLGMSMRKLTDQEASALGVEPGRGVLVQAVAPGSPAEENGVAPGDVILEINQQPVNNPAEAQRIINEDAKRKGVALLLLSRRGQNLFVTIPMGQ
ncbi:DegQ family serine endoprotease [Desulfocurvibacter africanus]|uniref:DegQ family serine endoprotease n=1 Tax=Desulfocurvibacter africanus TaxID=873 RepID=UPI00040524B7|nr:DegQ family serine endoprotease [Desulfocurvibacter africanus]